MSGMTSIGMLARSLQLRTDNARLTSELDRLTTELSSGRKSHPGVGQSRDVGPLAALERSMTLLDSHAGTIREAALVAETTQATLGNIDAEAGALGGALLIVQGTGQAHLVDTAAADARSRFNSVVGQLNVTIGGRSLFSGTAFDSPALVDGETMLAELAASVTGAMTAADVLAGVDAWFDTGGGFETTAYLGSADPVQPARLGDGGSTQPTARAIDPEIKGVLRTIATAALLDLGVLDGAPDERAALTLAAGRDMMGARAGLVTLRSGIGQSEERLATAATRTAAEKTSVEIARNELVSADPFDTAQRLKAAEAQLQTLYILTGRLSDLSLTNYLR